MANEITWTSPTGHSLTFGVYQYDGVWNDVSGIYMFCRLEQNGSYIPLYIGQAQSFRDRLARHEQWNPAVRIGASTVHAAVVAKQADRDMFERLLIQHFQPILNQQLK